MNDMKPIPWGTKKKFIIPKTYIRVFDSQSKAQEWLDGFDELSHDIVRISSTIDGVWITAHGTRLPEPTYTIVPETTYLTPEAYAAELAAKAPLGADFIKSTRRLRRQR